MNPNKKLKILIVMNNVWPPPIEVTGLSAIYNLAKEISKNGHEVHFLTSVGVWEKDMRGSKKATETDLQQIKEWHEQQNKEHGFVFHTYTTGIFAKNPQLSFVANRAFPLFLVPKLFKKHKFDIVHEISGTPALVYRSWLLQKLIKAKLFHTLIGEVPGFTGSIKWLHFAPKISGVFATSKRIYNNLLRLGYSEKNAHFNPLSIDISKFQKAAHADEKQIAEAKKSYGINENEFTFLFLAPLDSHKGPNDFAKAAVKTIKKHKNTKFIYATYESGGAVPYSERKQQVLDIIKDYKDNFVILEGTHDVINLLTASECLVLPQTTIGGATGYPVTLIEGMAAETLTIMAALPPIKEIMTDGENGLLFEVGNSEELGDKFIEAVEMSPEKRAKNIKNALQLTNEKFSIKSAAKNDIELYLKSLDFNENKEKRAKS